MDVLQESRWSQAFPWLAETGRSADLRRLLESSEASYRSSAAQLRACGQQDLAGMLGQRAAWVRFALDEPYEARRLYAVTKDLRNISQPGLLLTKVLDGALRLLGCDRGNVQIFDQSAGSLKIVAQHGFDSEFLDYFATMKDDRSACGRAAKNRAQTIIVDVTTDSGFAPHRDIAAASGFRAVQSTPLVDQTGRLLGVLSTHYPRPYQPGESDLRVIKHCGELAGETINQLSTSLRGYLAPRAAHSGRASPPVADGTWFGAQCRAMLGSSG